MRVALVPLDENGCGLHRMLYPARQLANAGEIELIYDGPARTKAIHANADVIVFQRPTRRAILSLIPACQRRGIAVVVELDDDLMATPRSHPAFRALHPAWSPDENWEHLRQAALMADLVTVSTPALERWGLPGRVRVIRNCVPEALLSMPRSSDGTTAGWAGATWFHPGDLALTRGGVAQAVHDHGWRFRVVGPAGDAGQQLGLPAPISTGKLTVPEYDMALGGLDAGIVPLVDSQFGRAKSNLKGLQYAARGVPFVASPLPEYQRLAKRGVGLLAKDGADGWRRQLKRLLGDEGLREESVGRGRALIAERYTYERQAGEWLDAWEQALRTRRSAHAVAA